MAATDSEASWSKAQQEAVIAGRNVTAVDGRYAEQTRELSEITSEYALMGFRTKVEVEWLKFLLSGGVSELIPAVSDQAIDALSAISDGYDDDAYLTIKDHETKTRHDVKAVEYYLRGAIADNDELRARSELVHFGATSEDTNNLSYAMMVSRLRGEIFVPHLSDIQQNLATKAIAWSDIPMVGMTHGQAATPLTLGKAFAVPADRLRKQIDGLNAVEIEAKWNGATGNLNALYAADPDTDWARVSKEFVESMGFKHNAVTTQIEPFDWFADFAFKMAHIDGVLGDFDRNAWMNIMLKRLAQIPEEGATGSSTMPQKINPIMFENSEGNAEMAARTWFDMGYRLLSSRLERDLSGSTVIRGLGDVAGKQLVSLKSVKRGLAKVTPNELHMQQELDDSYPVVSEAMQTILRIHSQVDGASDSYDVLKQMTRGKDFTAAQAEAWINSLDDSLYSAEVKEKLAALLPATYIGIAPRIARGEIASE